MGVSELNGPKSARRRPDPALRPVPGYARRVIVVIGDPILHPFDGHAPALAGGPAAAIARACVLAGATVQLAGKVGDDPAGDEVLLSLNRDGIGHVALLRNAGGVQRQALPGQARLE